MYGLALSVVRHLADDFCTNDYKSGEIWKIILDICIKVDKWLWKNFKNSTDWLKFLQKIFFVVSKFFIKINLKLHQTLQIHE